MKRFIKTWVRITSKAAIFGLLLFAFLWGGKALHALTSGISTFVIALLCLTALIAAVKESA